MLNLLGEGGPIRDVLCFLREVNLYDEIYKSGWGNGLSVMDLLVCKFLDWKYCLCEVIQVPCHEMYNINWWDNFN